MIGLRNCDVVRTENGEKYILIGDCTLNAISVSNFGKLENNKIDDSKIVEIRRPSYDYNFVFSNLIHITRKLSSVWNDFNTIWRDEEEEPTKEVTMEEIAQKFNVKVENLKIKGSQPNSEKEV